jgi:hypothetical protein
MEKVCLFAAVCVCLYTHTLSATVCLYVCECRTLMGKSHAAQKHLDAPAAATSPSPD